MSYSEYLKWKVQVYKNTGIEWGDRRGDVTGKILFDSEDLKQSHREHTIEYKFWKLTLNKNVRKESKVVEVSLHIRGNPPKIYYGGRNYSNVPLEIFWIILLDFEKKFCLSLNRIKIAGPTEASVTLTSRTIEFSQSLIKGKILSGETDKDGNDKLRETQNSCDNFMGYQWEKSHTTIKIYLPSLKFREPTNSIRVEVRYNKIQTLQEKHSIQTWQDLLQAEVHINLYEILLNSWDNIIVVDRSLKRNKRYENWLNEMIFEGKTTGYWTNKWLKSASDKTRKKRMKHYRQLSFSKGEGLHEKIRRLIEKEGSSLRNITTWLTGNNSELLNIEDLFKLTNKQRKLPILSHKQLHGFTQNLKQINYQKFSLELANIKTTNERVL